jgi:branched-chain amino acid transport system substrate-binding protein
MFDSRCRRVQKLAAVVVVAITAAIANISAAIAADPVRIGYGIAMTGPLAANGKSALLAHRIWEEDINARGGLLGRPVKLIYYDDQSNPASIPGIYTKLLDVDKVDFVVGGYATNMVAPALPVVMQKKKLFIGLLALAVNSEFNYPLYFSMSPTGGMKPKESFSEGFFEVAMQQNPKPQTLALVGADAEFSRNAADGAREIAKRNGLKIVYDRSYPPSTTDFAPIVRAVAASNPDLVCVLSYPLDTVGVVRAVNEIGYKPKMIGCGMVGLQATAFKTQLGPLLNGIVNYDFWLPAPNMRFPGVMELLERYQARASAEGVDQLGYYMAPWGYTQLQVLGQAIEATKSLEDAKIAEYMRAATFKTVVGDIKFGPNGELSKPLVVTIQFHDLKNNDLQPFRDLSAQTILWPKEYKTGEITYPYADAKK